MGKRLWIINGPNLNLLGSRQKEIYGANSFDEVFARLTKKYSEISMEYHQSNVEGELVNIIQEARLQADGVVLNAAAYAHTSIAIADAVAAIDIPVVGVHISNIYTREQERHTDLLAKYCEAFLFGFGTMGYDLAIQYLVSTLKD